MLVGELPRKFWASSLLDITFNYQLGCVIQRRFTYFGMSTQACCDAGLVIWLISLESRPIWMDWKPSGDEPYSILLKFWRKNKIMEKFRIVHIHFSNILCPDMVHEYYTQELVRNIKHIKNLDCWILYTHILYTFLILEVSRNILHNIF